MADFRRHCGHQVASGQSMGGLSRFAELLAHEAVDILQPNVVNCGGYTGGLRAADLALGFSTPICNGGGSTQHNLHLQAGAVNGTICEWHPVPVGRRGGDDLPDGAGAEGRRAAAD